MNCGELSDEENGSITQMRGERNETNGATRFHSGRGGSCKRRSRGDLIAANSMILHEIYFDSLGGGATPAGALAEAITRDFGSLDRWRTQFSAMGKAEGGGSGWVILSYSPRDKRLVNQWAADHTTTLAGGRPVLVLDMYEHAYHMDYGAAAARYVDVFMDAIRWDNAVKLFERYSRES